MWFDVYYLYVKKVLGKNVNSTSIKQRYNRSLKGEVLEQEMVCAFWFLWKLWCRVVSVHGKGEDNMLFYLIWTYAAPQGKTLNPEYMNNNYTDMHEQIKSFFPHIKILKMERKLMKNWIFCYKIRHFQEEYKFHLIIILVEQNSLQLNWYKHLY